MPQHVQERAPHDAEVEPETPVFHVPDVGLHAVLHLVQCLRLAAEALHLCPSRDAGIYQLAHHVTAEQTQVFLRMEQHVWARPYEAHVASLCQLRNNFFSKISHKAQYYQLTLKISTKKEPLISQKSQTLRFYLYSISPNCTILA